MTSKLIVTGAAGRMGKRIIALAAAEEGLQIVGAVDHAQHPLMGKDAGLAAGVEALHVPLSADFPAGADVMIDFSLPVAAETSIDFCRDNGVALVLGTTGLSADQIARVNDAAACIPIMQATNYSLGMNLLFATVGKLAKALGTDYDIEIVEAHHRFKKDAPSGSALSLAQAVCEETGRDYPGCLTHGREGTEALRQTGTIGMHAVRGGDIVGDHSVIYSTLGETVTIRHNAHTRDTFVHGAIHAAKWLVGRTPGRYDMRDVLGLK